MTCVLADKDCAGRLEWHHAIKQQRLRREFKYGAWRAQSGAFKRERIWHPVSRHQYPDDPDIGFRSLDQILGDPRNRVWLCSHHHELVTNSRVDVVLPESVYEFADEFGLRAMLENDLARRAA